MTRTRCDVCGEPPSWWASLGLPTTGPSPPQGFDGVALCDACAVEGLPPGWTLRHYQPTEAS